MLLPEKKPPDTLGLCGGLYIYFNQQYLFLPDERSPRSTFRCKDKARSLYPALKDKAFLKYFVMLIIYNFGIQIAGAFYSVYLKSDLI